jgi:type I restriction enzyme M protein
MNKQQLASKIWQSANKMRSKIEASEYKDYILGFMFYKFLSDKEVRFLKDNDYTDADIQGLSEEKEVDVNFIKPELGYFISHENLFSTWISAGRDFEVSNVRTALSAFDRLINPAHKKVFDGIFNTLQTGLSKLGDSAQTQSKAISDLIALINDIPMDGRQDYDVLGFIYEYLIGMFAANAGKKAGEFYTPHEVSFLMSEITADHLKDRKTISIYDPTSGSGSLLINIGNSVAKHIDDKNNIKYYAQELMPNTYNLTRMNLVMRGIIPSNIETRNGDTLAQDWPFFDESDPVNSYDPLYLDAVVSNPPYSQPWDSTNKESDSRYADFGIAPKTKADYAFLLHDLFHLKPDGIMTIILPHGVLFRGGEEGEIRKKLIEREHIETIIGLPPNIFFGTGIPTIVMVLKQKRENSDVLIVDASKGFKKVGTDNQLQASDIKKIVDTVLQRESIDKYSRVVDKDEIRNNDYNLNIPRYVDSSEPRESWDIYSSMFGGMPKTEVELLSDYWNAFPSLQNELFENLEAPYLSLKVDNLKDTISKNINVQNFVQHFADAFDTFGGYLKSNLIENIDSVAISKQENVISDEIFSRLEKISLVDKYSAFQILDDVWKGVATDLEIIQTEGFSSTKIVDPNMVVKKKDKKEVEVQDGWVGRIIPFELVQSELLSEENAKLQEIDLRLLEISAEIENIIDSFTEEEKSSQILNDDNTAFVSAELKKEIKSIYKNVETEEIIELGKYLVLLTRKPKKPEKQEFIEKSKSINWTNIEANKDGTYAAAKVNAYVLQIQKSFVFEEDSFEFKVLAVNTLLEEERDLKKKAKVGFAELQTKTKATIESLEDSQVLELLEKKWILPILSGLSEMPEAVVSKLVKKLQALSDKYAVTYSEVANEIADVKRDLSQQIDELVGSEFDLKGLAKFQRLLGGDR